MLDTNTLSDIARERSISARKRLKQVSVSGVCLSSITLAEVLFGLERLPQATALRRAMLPLVQSLQVLAWGDNEAAVYSVLRTQLQSSGRTVSSLDLLIAAHAMSAGAVLVTRDRDFRHIPNLQIENWATDLQ